MTQTINKAKQATYLLVAFFVVLHLSLATSFGVSVDEAHYGLYALNLDWSYFDHPPMVGWLLALGRPFGLSEFVLRLIPTLIMTLNCALLYQLTSRIYRNPRVGFIAVALFQLGAITQLLGWGMVPDIPLMTWNLLIANLLISLRDEFHWQMWLLFGFFVGLTGLTKYTAIAIPISIFIWLLWERQLITWLRQPPLWLSIIIALIMILPVLLWNHWNQWISFDYQFNHGTAGDWQWKNVGKMQIVQFAAYSPLLFILAISFILTKIFGNKESNKSPTRYSGNKQKKASHSISGERYLLCGALVNLAIVAWSSGNGELLPHWASIGWLLFTPLAAYQLQRSWGSIGGKIWISMVGLLSIVLVSLVFILLAIKPVKSIPGSKDALMDLVGWEAAAHRAEALANQHNAPYLWVANWADASRIAWYTHPSIIQVADNKMNQFEVWNGYPQGTNRAILTLPKRIKDERTPTQRITPVEQNQCTLIDELPYSIEGIEVNVFWYYLCQPLTLDDSVSKPETTLLP
ncbi:hypothetical protein A9Q99_18830 [Gammaproteobacteria bacterium 45_16_T64]|nr:hypothetical protein A9Q99_18830 [Gammaproteobacteria bacterium 45_16_T64]